MFKAHSPQWFMPRSARFSCNPEMLMRVACAQGKCKFDVGGRSVGVLCIGALRFGSLGFSPLGDSFSLKPPSRQ